MIKNKTDIRPTNSINESDSRRGWKLARVGTAVASLVGTIGIHVGIWHNGGDAGDHFFAHNNIELTGLGHTREVPQVGGVITEGPHSKSEVMTTTADTTTTPGETANIVNDYPLSGDTRWSEAFAASETARETNASAGEKTTTLVKSLKDQNFSDIKVEVYGKTSAEDNTPNSQDGGLAGVQTESPANKELGDTRGTAFVNALHDSISDSDITIEQGESIEAQLSDSEVTVLETLTEQFGYDSVKDMIQHWNRAPDDVPLSVAETLSIFNTQRGVKVVITAERPATEDEKSSYSLDGESATHMLCVTSIQEVGLKPVNRHIPGEEHHVPVALPFMVLIPVIRRRTKVEQASHDARVASKKASKERNDRHQRLIEAQIASLKNEGTGASNGDMGDVAGPGPVPDDESDVTIVHPPIKPEVDVVPSEVEPPKDDDEEDKNGCIIPLVLVAGLAMGIGGAYYLNHDDSHSGHNPPVEQQKDNCEPGSERAVEVTRKDGTKVMLHEGEMTKDSVIMVKDGRVIFLNK